MQEVERFLSVRCSQPRAPASDFIVYISKQQPRGLTPGAARRLAHACREVLGVRAWQVGFAEYAQTHNKGERLASAMRAKQGLREVRSKSIAVVRSVLSEVEAAALYRWARRGVSAAAREVRPPEGLEGNI